MKGIDTINSCVEAVNEGLNVNISCSEVTHQGKPAICFELEGSQFFITVKAIEGMGFYGLAGRLYGLKTCVEKGFKAKGQKKTLDKFPAPG
jgi:hypothetical protein